MNHLQCIQVAVSKLLSNPCLNQKRNAILKRRVAWQGGGVEILPWSDETVEDLMQYEAYLDISRDVPHVVYERPSTGQVSLPS